ncbi:hypothetical protein LTR56_009825 [Elasticomyces elasticus]|nr:hypothetical protein LTR56_009825 [Elasticomyces elasticus]KAK3659140.1 hypothetical protein LTR22_008603 [Elasticomyces elasticus]KAK4923182.1 hypothetical protein LTR49_009650 [Elasticomyces elasticus]KAK5761567.1 hypothetical protein LTS12_008359 [Elasticomyces elasticus]
MESRMLKAAALHTGNDWGLAEPFNRRAVQFDITTLRYTTPPRLHFTGFARRLGAATLPRYITSMLQHFNATPPLQPVTMASTTLMPSDRFLAEYWWHRAQRAEQELQVVRAPANKVPDWLQTVSQHTTSQHKRSQSMDSDELMRELRLQREWVNNIDIEDALFFLECEAARDDDLRAEGAADLPSTTLLGRTERQWVAGLTLLAMGMLFVRWRGEHA